MSRSLRGTFLVVLAVLCVSPRPTTAAPTSFTNSRSIAVPDSGAASPFPSEITVSGVRGQVIKVTVTLIELSHTRPPDLDVLLVGPRGQTVLLLSDCSDTAPVADVTPIFDDFGRRLTPGAPVPSARIKPCDVDLTTDAFAAPAPARPYGTRLSVFNGTDPNGVWNLFVTDDEADHSGTIAGGWVLTLHTQTIASDAPVTARAEPPALRDATPGRAADRPTPSLYEAAVTSRASVVARLTTGRSRRLMLGRGPGGVQPSQPRAARG